MVRRSRSPSPHRRRTRALTPHPFCKFAAKAARLKDADKEAQEEIETFKMKREAHFATFKAEKSKDSGGHSGKVNKETDAELVAIKTQVQGLLAPRLASPRVPHHAPTRAAAGEHQQGRGDQDALAVGDDRRRLEVERRSRSPSNKIITQIAARLAEAHVEDHHHDKSEHQPLHRQRLVAVRL